MKLMMIAWRNLMNRKLQTAITLLVVAVGVALTLSVINVADGMKRGMAIATEPYGMIVGSKGSANQLVFNTIYLMDRPLQNITLEDYETLKADPRVETAVPFALGDNYQGYRIVGTDEGFFHLRAKPKEPEYFQLKSGSLFSGPFEAVIGEQVAKSTGLSVGDSFVSSHGVIPTLHGEEHGETPYKVVGILKATRAPADKGIYVSMDSYWESHGQHQHDEEAAGEADEADEAAHEEEEPGVTAVLVKPDSYIHLMELYQEINGGNVAQAVFPGEVIAKVFDMMGTGEEVLRMIAYLVLGIAGLTTFLSLYGSTLERRRTVSILRAIGASRTVILSTVLLESLFIVIYGVVLGYVLNFGLSALVGHYIELHSSISFSLSYTFTYEHLQVLLGVCGVGLIAGFLPAVSAYRTEPVKYLNASA